MFGFMNHLSFYCCCFTLSYSLRTLNQDVDCSQPGFDNCKIGNCSEPIKVGKLEAPKAPEWVAPVGRRVVLDRGRYSLVLNVSWRIHATADRKYLRGSQVRIRDEQTKKILCLEYSYNLVTNLNPNNREKWTFSLDGVVVQPEHSYHVSVHNIPYHNSEGYSITRTIPIGGCGDNIVKKAQECRENGSLWQPQINTTPSLDWSQKIVHIVVSFNTSEYSERYKVFLKSHSEFPPVIAKKENRTSINVTFKMSVSEFQHCEIVAKIQPFFKQCNNECWSPEESSKDCPFVFHRTMVVKTILGVVILSSCLVFLLWGAFSTASTETTLQLAHTSTPQCIQMAQRKRVLIIYSLDHPLYKNIVLKLCSFLMAKCGTEVVLDMLDSTRLGIMGSIQWLECHRKQIETSSDKILILCSRGVQAKWRAICSGQQLQLREDAHSIFGDTLVPALCLMVPEFVKSMSFEKYIVAYFDGVSTDDDVPSPFNITVRYKLMKQFEELFFRILDCEKHEMGKVNRIEGLSEEDYHLCPTGRALRNAIEDFHAYQLEHPGWFEEELIGMTKRDTDQDFVLDSVCQDKIGQIVRIYSPEAATIPISDQPVQLSAL